LTASAARPAVPRVHVVTVVGGESALLSHFFSHYRGLGVESFYVIRHAESEEDPNFKLIEEQTAAAGIDLFKTYIGPWDDLLHGRLMTEAMAEHPDEWYIMADLDEFHRYDRPLGELLDLCDEGGYTHVCGCFVDRVAADGTLPEVTSQPLWGRYPLGGAITSRLAYAPTLKIGLARGAMGTGGGHHGTPGSTGLPSTTSYIQVHHFKWTAGVVERLRLRVQRYRSGAWQLRYPSVVPEARRILEHLSLNSGRIDVSDPRLCLGACGPGYHDYELWPQVAEDAQGWAQIFDGA